MPLRLQLDGPNSPQTYFFKNLHSITHLSSIASQIGPDRTRETLIPYLSNGNEQVSVDVLQEMAIQLPHLIPCVGGLDHAHELFQPFQSLFAFNLNTVRDKAVDSLAQIATQAQGKNSQFVTKFRDFVEKLATSDLDTHRASSCGLFHTAFPNQSPQTEHVQLYSNLCKDKTPLVRRSPVMYFAEFYRIVRMSDMEGMRTNFTLLAHDDQDYVRLFAANVFSHLIKTGFFSLEDVTEIVHTISEFSEIHFKVERYFALLEVSTSR